MMSFLFEIGKLNSLLTFSRFGQNWRQAGQLSELDLPGKSEFSNCYGILT